LFVHFLFLLFTGKRNEAYKIKLYCPDLRKKRKKAQKKRADAYFHPPVGVAFWSRSDRDFSEIGL